MLTVLWLTASEVEYGVSYFFFLAAGTLITIVFFCSSSRLLVMDDLRDTRADAGRSYVSKQLFLMFSNFFAYFLINRVGISTINSLELKYFYSAFQKLGFSN